jgi:hypothetical protein
VSGQNVWFSARKALSSVRANAKRPMKTNLKVESGFALSQKQSSSLCPAFELVKLTFPDAVKSLELIIVGAGKACENALIR